MRWRDSLKIACQNIRIYKGMTRKIVFCLFIITMVIFCFLIFLFSYGDFRDSFWEKYASECYIYINENVEDNKNEYETSEGISYNEYLENIVSYHQIARDIGASEISDYSIINFNFSDETKLFSGAVLEVDGRLYTAKALPNGMLGRKIYETTESMEITTYQRGNSFIPRNCVKDDVFSNYIYGSYPENPGEVMVSDYILESYGFTKKQQRNLIGKKISLFAEDETKNKYFSEYILTGIFKAEVMEKREYEFSGNTHTEHIAVNLRKDEYDNINLKSSTCRFYFTSYQKLQEGQQQLEKVFPERVEINYKGNKYSIVTKCLNVIYKILFFLAVGLVFAMSVSVINMLHFFLQRNTEYFSMMRKIGMQSFNIYQIYFFELLTLISIAVMIGTYSSIVLVMIFNIVYRNIVESDLMLNISTCFICIIFLFAYFIALLGIYTGVQCRKIVSIK